MALLVIALPILPGKTDRWRQMGEELTGPRREQFVASREQVGIRERTFLQHTPNGDLVIVTAEGADPIAAFAQLGQQDDDFSRWFIAQAREIHGIDLSNPPSELPELVIDSGAD